MTLAVTGLENRASAALAAGTTLATAEVRMMVAVPGAPFEHVRRKPARRRPSLILPAFDLMTDCPSCSTASKYDQSPDPRSGSRHSAVQA